MSRESEMQIVQWAAADLQKRNDCKTVINDIFGKILQANSALRQYIAGQGLSFTNFETMLTEYQQALMEEVDFLPIEYMALKSNHPLRAAMALSNLNVPHETANAFLFNLQNFTKEANDSHFYPKTKSIVMGIVVGLLFAAIVALLILARLPTSASRSLLGGCMSLCAPVGFVSGLYTFGWNDSRYKPVYAAKQAGNRVAGFFAHPERHLAAQSEQSVIVRSDCVESRLLQEERDVANGEYVEPPPAYQLTPGFA